MHHSYTIQKVKYFEVVFINWSPLFIFCHNVSSGLEVIEKLFYDLLVSLKNPSKCDESLCSGKASNALSKSIAPRGLKFVPAWKWELKFIKDFFSIMLLNGRIWLEWQNFKFPMESTDNIFFSSKVGLIPPVNLNFPMLTCKVVHLQLWWTSFEIIALHEFQGKFIIILHVQTSVWGSFRTVVFRFPKVRSDSLVLESWKRF